MKVRAHILQIAFLTGAVIAQTAPASQTVNQNPPPSKQNPSPAQVKKDSTTAKTPAKNPFKPKPKTSQPSAQPSKSAQTSKSAQPLKSPQPAAATATAKAQTKTPAPAQKAAPSQATAKPRTPKPAAAKQAQPAQAKAAPKQETTKPAEVKKEAAPDVAQTTPRKLPSPGRRDPFVSPLAAAAARGPGAGCSTGKRCLVVDQIVLKGIVQMRTGNFALVENISKRPYVLHVNDSLFNGSVVKITGDSVVFREESNDILGRPVSKEVVKKVSAPAV